MVKGWRKWNVLSVRHLQTGYVQLLDTLQSTNKQLVLCNLQSICSLLWSIIFMKTEKCKEQLKKQNKQNSVFQIFFVFFMFIPIRQFVTEGSWPGSLIWHVKNGYTYMGNNKWENGMGTLLCPWHICTSHFMSCKHISNFSNWKLNDKTIAKLNCKAQ